MISGTRAWEPGLRFTPLLQLGFLWLTRVPESIKLVKQLIDGCR